MSYLCTTHELGATAPDVGINYRGGARQMPAWAEGMLANYLSAAGLDRCFVNSTMRTAFEQAAAMYANEVSGNHISYGAAGSAVLAVIPQSFGADSAHIIDVMAARITQLGADGQLISYHCDTAPAGYTAADISPEIVGRVGSSTYNNFLNVLRSAKNRGELKELLSPDVGAGNRGYDPAIHVVFVESMAGRAAAAAENALTGGMASSYEGEDSPGGIPVWAWIGGGAIATWLLLFKKKR